MSRKTDVIVVGAGLAGFAAALAAAREGCSVRMITSGMGSLAISGGTVDVLGYVDGRRLASPWEGLRKLPPEHPYSLLGADNIRAGLHLLSDCAREQGWPMHALTGPDGQERNILLP
ncbi:MAG: FAD-binding protein, partial [Desulfovibrionaceae bacterium]|nr:FAD-binding protein [Desulfovibrionaceae bacterium]